MMPAREWKLHESRCDHLLEFLISDACEDQDRKGSGYGLAVSLLRQGAWRRALDLFDRITPEMPQFVPAQSNKALCLYRLGDFDRAGRVLSSNLATSPDHIESLILLAEVLQTGLRQVPETKSEKADIFKEAHHYLRRAVETDPCHSGALYCKALADDGMGKREDAYRALCRFMAVTPEDEGEQVQYARRRLQEIAFWQFGKIKTGYPASTKKTALQNAEVGLRPDSPVYNRCEKSDWYSRTRLM